MVGSGSAWIRNFWLDLDAELGKFRAGPGSGINHSGSTTLLNPLVLHFSTEIYSSKLVVATPFPPLSILCLVWFRVGGAVKNHCCQVSTQYM